VAVASSILFMAISVAAATHCILSKSSDASALLRARRQRPRCCHAAEQRAERAPLHSITSSARASRGLAPMGWQDYKADVRHPTRKPRRSG
jgi:hypothetical protein